MLPPSESHPGGPGAPSERPSPSAPSFRASTQERHETVQRLQTAFVEGRLTDETFDERVRSALAAQTQAELAQLLADLPLVSPPFATTTPVTPSRSEASLIMAVMGGTERRGHWHVPAQCTVVALMGGCLLDLRAAQLSAPVTTFTVVAIMGGVEVIVPPGIRVTMHGLPLMGGWSNHVREEHPPHDAPEVHLRGFALMGGVEVRMRLAKSRA